MVGRKVAETQRNLMKLVQSEIKNNEKTLSVFQNIFKRIKA